jgi:hypothetical protein
LKVTTKPESNIELIGVYRKDLSMIEILDFTQEEIGNYGRGNAEGWLLGTISYFTSKGSGLEEWIDYVGKFHAQGWEAIEDKSPKNITREAALNWVSCGAKLISFGGDDTRAEAVLEFAVDETADWWKISTKDAQKLNRVFISIAGQVGLQFEWKSEGKRFRIIFSK